MFNWSVYKYLNLYEYEWRLLYINLQYAKILIYIRHFWLQENEQCETNFKGGNNTYSKRPICKILKGAYIEKFLKFSCSVNVLPISDPAKIGKSRNRGLP